MRKMVSMIVFSVFFSFALTIFASQVFACGQGYLNVRSDSGVTDDYVSPQSELYGEGWRSDWSDRSTSSQFDNRSSAFPDRDQEGVRSYYDDYPSSSPTGPRSYEDREDARDTHYRTNKKGSGMSATGMGTSGTSGSSR
jgi:hypothetical protein